MGSVLTSWVFNKNAIVSRNLKMAKQSQANIAHILTQIKHINIVKRQEIMNMLELGFQSVDLDTKSFDQVMHKVLTDIKSIANQETEEANAINRMADSLMKHFKIL